MPVRTSEAQWQGDLKGGKGTMKFGGGAFEGNYSFTSRFEEGTGTNPEELIAAAHAGCFSMAFAHNLAQAGFTPRSVRTTAKVEVVAGEGIKGIKLITEADVPGITPEKFQEQAEAAKVGCPVSKALAATNITLDAKLV